MHKLFEKLAVDCSNQLATSSLIREIIKVGIPLHNSAIFECVNESEKGFYAAFLKFSDFTFLIPWKVLRDEKKCWQFANTLKVNCENACWFTLIFSVIPTLIVSKSSLSFFLKDFADSHLSSVGYVHI